MVAPNNSPVVTSVPYSGPYAVLGQLSDRGSPTYIPTYSVVIPNTLLGNEWLPGYAAFTADGVNTNRGVSTYTLANFLGFFASIYIQEGNVGTNPYTTTFSNNFVVPVCKLGTIFVYNSTAISSAISSGLSVVTSVTTGTTPAAIQVGSVIQGATPAGATVVDISTVATVLASQTVVGAGVFLHVSNK